MLGADKSREKNGRVYTALDVGTTKVCTLVGSRAEDEEHFNIMGFGVAGTRGMKKAMVLDMTLVGDSVRESVKEAEKTSGLRLKNAFVGITGSHISSFHTTSTISLSRDKAVSKAEVERILENVHNVPMYGERELIHAIAQDYSIDDELWGKNPARARGRRLDADVHVVTAAVSAIRNLTGAVNKAGIHIDDMILEPLASGEAILREAERNVGVVVLDIGGGTTDIAVFRKGNIYHTAAIPVAGYQITRDLAIGLGVTYKEGEELKLKYANLDAAREKAYPYNEVVLKPREGLCINYADFHHIVTERLTELLQLVMVELSGENISKIAPAGFVLSGGTSKLPGIADFVRRYFNMPCRIGVPRNISGLVENLYDPAFSTSVGLLCWGARYSHTDLKKPFQLSPLERLWKRVRRRILK